MIFALDVMFSGLLHYVPNSSRNPQTLCKLCVVLPEAPGHRAVVAAAQGSGLLKDGMTVAMIEPIERKRVVFKFVKDAASPPVPFDFRSPVLNGRVKGAVPFERILGSFSDRDSKIVGPEPPASVRAQILIGAGGAFSVGASSSPPELLLPGELTGGGDAVIPMAEAVTMRVAGLKSAEVIVLPLANSLSPEARYSIVPNGQGNAKLVVAHDCAAQGELKVGDDDKDFRFHYSLLGQPLAGRRVDSLPLPKINKFSGHSQNFTIALNDEDLLGLKPDGCNCAASSGLPRPYHLDKFMMI
jgi:hypothetical protein